MADWRMARSLDKLREQLNDLAPNLRARPALGTSTPSGDRQDRLVTSNRRSPGANQWSLRCTDAPRCGSAFYARSSGPGSLAG